MLVIETKNAKETKKTARLLARELSRTHLPRAVVLGLNGNLGAGKTTFMQGLAEGLGVKENVLSPTFVLLKIYALSKKRRFRHLIHIDSYRLDSPKELLHLGLADLLKDKDAVIAIEWADRVKKILPKDTIWIEFKHGKKLHERIIQIKSA